MHSRYSSIVAVPVRGIQKIIDGMTDEVRDQVVDIVCLTLDGYHYERVVNMVVDGIEAGDGVDIHNANSIETLSKAVFDKMHERHPAPPFTCLADECVYEHFEILDSDTIILKAF